MQLIFLKKEFQHLSTKRLAQYASLKSLSLELKKRGEQSISSVCGNGTIIPNHKKNYLFKIPLIDKKKLRNLFF